MSRKQCGLPCCAWRSSVVSDHAPLDEALELAGIRFVEVACRRTGSPPWPDFPDLSPDEALLRVRTGETAQGRPEFHARLSVRGPEDDACFRIEVVVRFGWQGDAKAEHYEPRELKEFLESTGLDVAFPYLREALASSAVRMGGPTPVLPLLPRLIPLPTEQESLPESEED